MNNTIRVSKYEFVKYTTKYLKGDTVIITHRGEDCLKLESMGYIKTFKPVSMIEPGIQKNIRKIEHAMKVFPNPNTHGCGCPKKESGLDLPNIDKVIHNESKGRWVVPGINPYEVYGCGCRKEEGKFLCKKHGRF